MHHCIIIGVCCAIASPVRSCFGCFCGFKWRALRNSGSERKAPRAAGCGRNCRMGRGGASPVATTSGRPRPGHPNHPSCPPRRPGRCARHALKCSRQPRRPARPPHKPGRPVQKPSRPAPRPGRPCRGGLASTTEALASPKISRLANPTHRPHLSAAYPAPVADTLASSSPIGLPTPPDRLASQRQAHARASGVLGLASEVLRPPSQTGLDTLRDRHGPPPGPPGHAAGQAGTRPKTGTTPPPPGRCSAPRPG